MAIENVGISPAKVVISCDLSTHNGIFSSKNTDSTGTTGH
jgi:hypothetical protein